MRALPPSSRGHPRQAAVSLSSPPSARCSQKWQNDSQRGESCQVQWTGSPPR